MRIGARGPRSIGHAVGDGIGAGAEGPVAA
jgi:hypothetical protein